MSKAIIARYAQLGYPVLPLEPGEKRPLARLVPRGLKDATKDPKTISYWLKDAPDAGVGILPPEDVLVLDFDRPEAWQDLLRRYPVLESYPRQRTPSGGVHVFMRIPEAAVGKLTTSVRIMDGVDIRGLGKAYVATAPTQIDGAEYVWEVPLVSPEELPEIPAGLLLELMEASKPKDPPPPPRSSAAEPGMLSSAEEKARKQVEGLIRWACGEIERAPEGTRHITLWRYGRAVGGWVYHVPSLFDQAHQALYEAALSAGLPHGESWRTARDALMDGMKDPLPLPSNVQEAYAYLDWAGGKAGITDTPAKPAHPLEGLSGGLLLADGKPQYVVRNGVLHLGVLRGKNSETEVVYTPLCAFSAVIRRVIEETDGAETTLTYEIEGYLEDGTPLPSVQVPAKEFASLEWVRSAWGPDATIGGAPGAERHIRAAIEFLSRKRYEAVKIYRHTGWTKIGNRWCYLHAGGAIGAEDEAGIRVELPSRLAGFVLPAPPKDPYEAAEAHLELLGLAEVAKPHIALPLVLYTLSAPLGRAPYPLYLAGPTQAGKTSLALLMQSAFAPGLELPAQNWSSTANALEGTAFTLKDSLLVADDYAPSANRWTREDLQAKAEQIIRAQVSGTGRARLRADGRLKGDRPPRCNLLITGEDLPHTHSIRNRVLFLEVGRGDVDFAKLSRAQALARKGVFARAMASWIEWLAPRLDEVRRRLAARIEELRPQWKGVHNRTATALAHLQAVWGFYNEYLLDIGLELGERAHEMFTEALRTVAAWQEDADRDADPVERFPELLQALFASGKAHLMPMDQNGLAPEEYMATPAAWGWKFRITSRYKDDETGEFKVTGVWEPQGHHIGWVPEWPEGEGIYLIPDVAWAVLNRLAMEAGTPLPSKKALWTQLASAGLIASRDEGGKRRFSVLKWVNGHPVRVVHVLPRALFEEEGSGDESPTPPGGGQCPIAPQSPQGTQAEEDAPPSASSPSAELSTAPPSPQAPAPPSHAESASEGAPEEAPEETMSEPSPVEPAMEEEKMEKELRNLALLMEVFNVRPVAFNPKDERVAQIWARINQGEDPPPVAPNPAERSSGLSLPIKASSWAEVMGYVEPLAERLEALAPAMLEVVVDGETTPKAVFHGAYRATLEGALKWLLRKGAQTRGEIWAVWRDRRKLVVRVGEQLA